MFGLIDLMGDHMYAEQEYLLNLWVGGSQNMPAFVFLSSFLFNFFTGL